MTDFGELKQKYNLMSLEDALVACFGKIDGGDGELEGYKVSCCGDVGYGSGVVGSDIARCEKCGRRIVNVLSPHVSPLLIQGSTTGIPSDEMFEALWETPWMVIIPEPDSGAESQDFVEAGVSADELGPADLTLRDVEECDPVDWMERVPDYGVQPDGSVDVKHRTRSGRGAVRRLIERVRRRRTR